MYLENTGITIGGGINTYNSDLTNAFSKIGGNGEIGFNKWVSSCIGFRAQFGFSVFPHQHVLHGQSIENVDAQLSNIYTVSNFTADMAILFDPFHTSIKHFDPANIRGYFICGLGYIYADGSPWARDHDFLVYLSYNQEFFKFNINDDGAVAALFIEPKLTFFQPEFLHNKDISMLLSGSVGINFKFNSRLRHSMYRPSKIRNFSKFWQEDWYLGLGTGIASIHYLGVSNNVAGLKRISPTGQVTIGKYNSPGISTRLQVDFGSLDVENILDNQDGISSLGYAYIHADIMFNLTSILCKPDKTNNGSDFRGNFFNVEPFAGLGTIWRIGDSWSYASDAGVRFRFAVSDKSDIWAEYRYTQLMNRFIHDDKHSVVLPEQQTITSVCYHSLMIGYNYQL